MSNKSILNVSCLHCNREIGVSHHLYNALTRGLIPLCKYCEKPLEINFGDTCRFHGENILKGYCNSCANDELIDNNL